jgi:hypothetical protein
MRYLRSFFHGLIGAFKHLPEMLVALLRLPLQLWRLFLALCRIGFRCLRLRIRCRDEIHIPPEVYKRPDPMLYSQTWLMSMGVSVTWDNPDIQLYLNGAPVSSKQLQADTTYEVRVRVWNNSYDAPAPGLPVHLTAFGFGIGTSGAYVGKRIIDLGAKGTSQCPAFASFSWTTPQAAGHYCLQAKLDWPDDANPQNNLGQENTDVAATQSPAVFNFRLRNRAAVDREFTFGVDDYVLPEKDPCEDPPKERPPRIEESRRRWAETRKTQGYGQFSGWQADWKVDIDPAKPTLGPQQEVDVKVSIEPLAPGFSGSKPFNINAFAALPDDQGPREFVGGVTLVVESS